jgi:hypothetical protein
MHKVSHKSFLILSFFLLIASYGCKRQKQLWFGAIQRTHAAEQNNVVRLYFDKWGNLYPNINRHIPYKSFFDPINKKNTYNNEVINGNLESYYEWQHVELQKLFNEYGINTFYATAKDSFYAVQNKLIKLHAEKISGPLNTSVNKTLIVFIHGFNDPDPTGDYQQLRDSIKAKGYANEETVYLELFWDGLTSNQGNPGLAKIWGRAQRNSAYASLTLRNILSQLPIETKIRIITHSLGASVGTGALFNTTSKWIPKYAKRKDIKALSEIWDYFKLVKEIPAPKQNDIRIGMLAAAIPGESTFVDFEQRNWAGSFVNNISRVVVGFNVNDYAVSKRVGRSDFLASRMGATSLGCNLVVDGISETTRVKSILDAKFPTIFRSVDFSEFNYKQQPEEHGLYYYLLRPQSADFLKNIFE